MHSEVNEISPVLVEVKIEIPWDRVAKELDESFRKVGRTARIKGFRPGKVPPNVVRKVFAKQVKGEVTATLVEEGLLHAVATHALQIVAQPQLEAPTLEEGSPLRFEAKIEVRPKVESVDLSRLTVERPATEVADADVDAEIGQLRRQHAEVRIPEPMRPARAGDRLVIDYRVSIGGEVQEKMGAEGRPVELGQGNLIEEFEEGLAGSVPGEEREIRVPFGDDHDQEELRGKEGLFTVQVRELRETLLPEVDDELAKDVGDYATLLELRLGLRKELEELAQQRAEAEIKQRLVDRLVETNEIAAPPSMVAEEQKRMLYELVSMMRMTGQRPDFGEDFRASMEERAVRKVKAAILLGAVARAEGLQATEEDVDRKLRELAERTGKHVAKVRAEHQGEQRELLESQILEEKLMAHLRSKATFVDAGSTGAAESAAAAGDEKAPKKRAKATKKAAEESVAGAASGEASAKQAPGASKPGQKSAADGVDHGEEQSE